MPLDGITAKCLAAELNQQLADARLDRIYQPDRYDIVLHLRRGSENLRLILSANPASPRLHLTTEARENPSEPPMFCMLLRKHLLGAHIISISTPGYERIFELKFSTVNELGDRLEKKLIVEIMGRHSNIIFLNQENRIHDAILHIDQSISRVREVMPARIYMLPPEQNKISPQEALERIEKGLDLLGPAVQMKSLDKALLETMQGFSPQLCHEVLYKAGLDDRYKPSQLSPDELHQLLTTLEQLLKTIRDTKFSPTVFFAQEGSAIPIDFHALPLHDYPYQKQVDTVSAAMDLFYLERNRQNTFKQKKQAMEKIICSQLEHVRKKLLIHETDQAESEQYASYRRFGDLILANFHLASAGQSELLAIDYYQADQPEIHIPLQENRSASQNAQRYFKLYNKGKSRFETSSRLALADRSEITYLETLQNALAAAAEPEDLQALRQEISTSGLSGEPGKRQAGTHREEESANADRNQAPGKPGKKSRRQQKAILSTRSNRGKQGAGKGQAKPATLPPRQYTSADGFTILVGRNNIQNDQLTLKTAQNDDLWLHVQKIPGTHVIIRSNRQTVPDRTLQEAAEIAAWFSRAAASLPENQVGFNQKVAVDYCPVSHVKKPAGARPGMVIYEHYQTILVSPKEPRGHAGSSL